MARHSKGQPASSPEWGLVVETQDDEGHPQPTPMAANWSGYPNGQIPLSMMTEVRQEYFEPHGAQDMISMGAAFLAHFGKAMIITSGFRALGSPSDPPYYDSQWGAYNAYLHAGGPLAAYPGTSVHGYAQAADLGAGINNGSSAEHKWAKANGPTYGWNWGVVPSEPWHFEHPALHVVYNPGPTPGPEPIPDPGPNHEEEIMIYVCQDDYQDPSGVLFKKGWFYTQVGNSGPLRAMTNLEGSTYIARGDFQAPWNGASIALLASIIGIAEQSPLPSPPPNIPGGGPLDGPGTLTGRVAYLGSARPIFPGSPILMGQFHYPVGVPSTTANAAGVDVNQIDPSDLLEAQALGRIEAGVGSIDRRLASVAHHLPTVALAVIAVVLAIRPFITF